MFSRQDMAIAASQPVYDDHQNLLGVVSSDIFVSHISDFLQTLYVGQTGAVFVMERSGLLVASSTDEEPYTRTAAGEPQRRLSANESAIPAIRAAAGFLTGEFGDYHNINSTQQLFEFDLDGQRQFLQVLPFQDAYGIDWLVVTILPESDFTATITIQNRLTAVGVIIALGLSIVLGIVVAQWVTKPVQRLNASTQALAQGGTTQSINGGWITELDSLAHSFNLMAEQLQQTMDSLKAEIVERQAAEQRLSASEAKYRALIEQSYDVIYLVNDKKQVELINPRFTELLGYTTEEACIDSFNPRCLVAPQSQPTVEAWLRKYAQGEVTQPRLEFTAVDKAGNEIEVEVSVSTIFYDHTSINQGVMRDVTERVRAEGLLRQSNQRLEAALAELQATQEQLVHQERLTAVGQLAAGIAHDFNNILASITLYTDMALEMNNPTPPVRKNLEVIATQADRGARLVQQILDFGQRTLMVRKTLAMDSLVEEVVELLTRTLPESIQLHLDFEPGNYTVKVDATRVQQVLMNLALNARDFMPDGGELHLAIARVENQSFTCTECGLVTGGTWIQVTVRDTGGGIPADVLPHIFEPFFTTRAPLGHGLGLAQVYGIMKQHDGHIAVDTAVGQGTTFKLYWPAFVQSKSATAFETRQNVEAQGMDLTILVAEDNQVLREALVESLTLFGCHVLAVANGQEALGVFDGGHTKIDVVLTDWMMPGIGGLDLANQLAERDESVKVIVATGYPLDGNALKSAPANVVGWLQKPLQLKQLREQIMSALG